MEHMTLYARHYLGSDDSYSGITNGENWIGVYQGIYNLRSTRGDVMYPALKGLGCVNITRRYFIKQAKHPRKIIHQEGDQVMLFDYAHRGNQEYSPDRFYKPLPVLFASLGYPDILLNEITNIILTSSNNPKIRVNDNNRTGGENEGIINF